MIRLVAIDLDDTLLMPDLTISKANVEALQEVADRGVKVTLASGRMYKSTVPYSELLGLTNVPLITYNGALIKLSNAGETIAHNPLESQMAWDVLNRFKKAGFHVNIYLEDDLYMEALTPEGKGYMEISKVQGKIIGDFTTIFPATPTKMIGIGEEDMVSEMKQELEREFGGRVFFTKSKPTFIECLSPGINKAKGLSDVAAYLGINREEVMAIGDAPNDKEMLEWAGIGVAIGNASPEVKSIADWVAPTHDQDGVAAALRRFILN